MRTFDCGIVLCFPLLLAGCASDANGRPSDKELEWLRAHAIPISTPEAGHGFDDLRPLKDVIGDAHIVALGECTHGTREVFQMKHRLVEYLASELGFTVFSIEANMPEAYRLNEYVLEGKGDPRQLIAGMYFWTWNTEEVLAMVEWMRDFNRSGKGRIEFTGFDMQFPNVAMDVVIGFLRRVDSERTGSVEAIYTPLRMTLKRTSRTEPKTSRDVKADAKACEEILETMQASRDRYAAATSAHEADWAIQNARVVSQCMRLAADGPWRRDESMAENVSWILSQAHPGTRIVLWAHNGHVGRWAGGEHNAMGKYLDARYGKDQLVIGFAAGEGLYTAIRNDEGLRSDNHLSPPVNGAYEGYFRASGIPAFFLDLRAARSGGPAAEWIAGPLLFRSIGALAEPDQFSPTKLAEGYDAIIYLDRTSASRSMGRPVR